MMKLILFIFISAISSVGYTYLFCKLNNINTITKKSKIIFIMGIFVEVIFKYFDIKYFTIISFILFYSMLFYSLSKYSFKKVIINVLFIWLTGIILDLLAMILYSSICYVKEIDLNRYYIPFSIILSIVVFFILIIFGKCSIIRKFLIKVIKYFCDMTYLNFILILFTCYICFFAIYIFFNLKKLYVDVLLLIIMLLSLGLFLLIIIFKINDGENKKYLNTLKENNDFYIKIDAENRIFKHNLMAKLSSIKSVSNKKAIALIDDYVVKTNKALSFSKGIKRMPYGLNGIIYQKAYPFMEEIKFKINNKINFDIFNFLKPRRYNVLVEKLVVSLDNAIEASLNSKNKVVVINLYDDEENIYIEIKNSFAYNIDVDNLGNLNYSTKGKKRGLGLFSILRDNEASVNIKVVNNYFISVISAKKQK